MGIVVDIGAMAPKALSTWEEALFSPGTLLRRSVEPAEAFGFLVVSLGLMVALMAATSFGYLALFHAERLAWEASRDVDEKIKALFGIAGAWTVACLIAATLGSAWVSLVARTFGAVAAGAVFPKFLMIFGLEWLCAIPTALIVINHYGGWWSWAALIAVRLLELFCFVAIFRSCCAFSPVRTILATLLGAIPAVAVLVPVVHGMTVVLVGTAMIRTWD
jgi:hypothetical protein